MSKYELGKFISKFTDKHVITSTYLIQLNLLKSFSENLQDDYL